nr:aminotransferase class V-fold PLP-dependent enzyme [Bacteroidales bacterium]
FCNMDVKEIRVNEKGLVDVEALTHLVDETTAAIMLTNPNTLGLYEDDIKNIADIVHSSGALLYYDGANLNAIMNIVKPGEMGFDVMHVNVHKTFSTPHGGGGPGAGPVLVKEFLSPFLPSPHIIKGEGGYHLSFATPRSIGKTLGFWGNFLVLLRAYSYITHLGDEGLRYAAKMAVLNANYMKARLKDYIPLSHKGNYLHEIVLSLKELKEVTKITAFDVAKALIDRGYHPPTIYFPLIVAEAMMIEPTETESLRDIDAFVDTLIEIVKQDNLCAQSSHNTSVPRVDEVTAARKPILHW